MQTKKMSFASMQGKISKSEMRMIMAGDGGSSVLCGTFAVLKCNCFQNAEFYCCSNAETACVAANGCKGGHACVQH